MKKVLTWLLNHLKGILAIVTFGTTAIVVGVTMLNSYNSYLSYEKAYNENDLAVRSAIAPEAKGVEVLDSFNSKLKYSNVTSASEVEVEEQEKTYLLTVELSKTAFVDIDFVVTNSGDEIENVFSVMNVKVNDTLMDEEATIPENGTYHLALTGFAIAEGDLKIEVSPISGKATQMPEIEEISIFASVALR